jgi:hypothetical protein
LRALNDDKEAQNNDIEAFPAVRVKPNQDSRPFEIDDARTEENAAYILRWDRLATRMSPASLHMDVRFLACPSAGYTPYSPIAPDNSLA